MISVLAVAPYAGAVLSILDLASTVNHVKAACLHCMTIEHNVLILQHPCELPEPETMWTGLPHSKISPITIVMTLR